MSVCFLLPTGREKRATVGDAAVTWAGYKVFKKERKEMETRGSEGGCAEVADSERKISRRGS